MPNCPAAWGEPARRRIAAAALRAQGTGVALTSTSFRSCMTSATGSATSWRSAARSGRRAGPTAGYQVRAGTLPSAPDICNGRRRRSSAASALARSAVPGTHHGGRKRQGARAPIPAGRPGRGVVRGAGRGRDPRRAAGAPERHLGGGRGQRQLQPVPRLAPLRVPQAPRPRPPRRRRRRAAPAGPGGRRHVRGHAPVAGPGPNGPRGQPAAVPSPQSHADRRERRARRRGLRPVPLRRRARLRRLLRRRGPRRHPLLCPTGAPGRVHHLRAPPHGRGAPGGRDGRPLVPRPLHGVRRLPLPGPLRDALRFLLGTPEQRRRRRGRGRDARRAGTQSLVQPRAC